MISTIFAILLVAFPLTASVTLNEQIEQSEHYNLITALELKSWYDQDMPMIVLDARSEPYFDGILLPNAIWLPAESTDEEILSVLPSKDSLIAVYCHGVDCPASGWLYDKLDRLGYTNLFEYYEGIDDWMERGYPVVE